MLDGLLILLVFYGGLRWFERSNLFFPSHDVAAYPTTYGVSFEEVTFKAGDGAELRGWWIPAPQADAITILFFNGNAGNISHRLEKAMRLRRIGANLLLFDYRGYGRSRGWPSERGMYADAAGALRYLTEDRKLPSKHIILYGESLGAAVAVETARQVAVGGVILEAPFTSVREMCRHYYPVLPCRLVVNYRYDTVSKISELKAPILILHSPQDEIVPFTMGRRLFETARSRKTFVELRGSHNEGFLESGARYTEALRTFIKESL